MGYEHRAGQRVPPLRGRASRGALPLATQGSNGSQDWSLPPPERGGLGAPGGHGAPPSVARAEGGGGADTVGRGGRERGPWAGPEAAEQLEACGQLDCSAGLGAGPRGPLRAPECTWTGHRADPEPHAVGTGLHGGFIRPASFFLRSFVYQSGLTGVSSTT